MKLPKLALPELTHNEKLWLGGSFVMSCGIAFDCGLATGVTVFGVNVMALAFIKAMIEDMNR